MLTLLVSMLWLLLWAMSIGTVRPLSSMRMMAVAWSWLSSDAYEASRRLMKEVMSSRLWMQTSILSSWLRCAAP